MRVGILGGTFDPPTSGHLMVASRAREALGLDEVWLTPTNDPWWKPRCSAAVDRLAMCRLAISGVEGVGVCSVDVDRGGATLTINTVKDLLDRWPEHSFTYLLGTDVETEDWQDWVQMQRLMRFVRILRPGHQIEDPLPIVDLHLPAGSSTQVREQIATGAEATDICSLVREYIASRGLYRTSSV